jgi:hypothetical protein
MLSPPMAKVLNALNAGRCLTISGISVTDIAENAKSFMMTFELKDLLHLITYLISVVAVFLSFRFKLSGHQEKLEKIDNILHSQKGSLNVIDKETCKQSRDQLFALIRKTENVNDMMLHKIESLNDNVLVIMVHLNIRTPDGIRLDDKISDKIKKNKDNV